MNQPPIFQLHKTNDTEDAEAISFELYSGEIHAVLADCASSLDDFLQLVSQNASTSRHFRLKKPRVSSALFGMITKDSDLFVNLSPLTNIFASTPWATVNAISMAKKYAEAIADLGIELDLNRSISDMNADEKLIIELLRLYVAKPDIILIVQTLELLSKEYHKLFFDIMDRLKASGAGLIYLTSKYEDAITVADRLSLLNESSIEKTFSKHDVRENPQKLAYVLSGWSDVQSDDRQIGVLKTLDHVRSITTSNFELKQVVEMITAEICRVFSADGCTVYICDTMMSKIKDFSYSMHSGRVTPRVKTDYIVKLMSKVGFFQVDDSMQECFCTSVAPSAMTFGLSIPERNNKVLIAVYYDWFRRITQKDRIMLETFGKEISIALETSHLMGRSVLLQESHHRIKNNLQMIVSLIYAQKNQMQKSMDMNSEKFSDAFDSTILRIKSIAVVHNMLCTENLTNNLINLRTMFREVVEFYHAQDTVRIEMDLEEIYMPYDKATSLALVINELISNSIKHAFLDSENNAIYINCEMNMHALRLRFRDNGVGMPEDFDIKKATSIGLSILWRIIRSYRGRVAYKNDNGTIVDIEFPRDNIFSV